MNPDGKADGESSAKVDDEVPFDLGFNSEKFKGRKGRKYRMMKNKDKKGTDSYGYVARGCSGRPRAGGITAITGEIGLEEAGLFAEAAVCELTSKRAQISSIWSL